MYDELDRIINRKKKVITFQCIILVLLAAFWLILNLFQVENVSVEGNRHYSSAQIRRFVENGWFGDNTLILSMKFSNREISDLPFIETMNVSVVDRNSIKVTVYEKSLAGYIQYLENYMYFDKDGVIVESSSRTTKGIPLITGLVFDHLVMYEKIPVEDEAIFQTILNMTQILSKNNLEPDRIYFDAKNSVTLYFSDLRVYLGDNEKIEEQLTYLKGIMSEMRKPLEEGGPEQPLPGGLLDLSNYETGKKDYSFKPDQ